jgi:hypothetical protein
MSAETMAASLRSIRRSSEKLGPCQQWLKGVGTLVQISKDDPGRHNSRPRVGFVTFGVAAPA